MLKYFINKIGSGLGFPLSQTTRAAIKTAIVNQAIIEHNANRIDVIALRKVQESEV